MAKHGDLMTIFAIGHLSFAPANLQWYTWRITLKGKMNMRSCGIEINGSEVNLVLLSKDSGLFQIHDCRQRKITFTGDDDQEAMRKFQFTISKLCEDYKISRLVIKSRPQKGKFAGSAMGFKLEAAMQLIPNIETVLIAPQQINEQLKYTPCLIDLAEAGLKKFQHQAFMAVYAFLSIPTAAEKADPWLSARSGRDEQQANAPWLEEDEDDQAE